MTSSRRNRFLSSTRIAGLVRNATGTRICAKTVRNRLQAAQLRGRRPYVCVPLTPDHRRIRLNWTRAHHRWTRQQWKQVVFIDESRFNLKCADGRLHVSGLQIYGGPESLSHDFKIWPITFQGSGPSGPNLFSCEKNLT